MSPFSTVSSPTRPYAFSKPQSGHPAGASKEAAFPAWLDTVTPGWNWNWDYLRLIQDRLAQVTAGTLKRLMLFLPPRHGKSEMTTIRYPVYRLEREPGFRVCVGCYNQSFAERFGRKARRIARDRFPLSEERSAAKEWETPAGGVFRSCGVGNPPTGEGFNLIVIDDPVKSREEADSEAYRERVWEWYTDDLYTRREPGAAIILIQTRWHQDDLAGRLLGEMERGGERWEVVSLPAEAEEGDALGRLPGEALCPERFPLEELAAIKLVQGHSYHALYQQAPVPREGFFFKVAALNVVAAAPAGLRCVRAWDMGATAGGGDYTAGVLMGTDGEGRFWVLDVVRGQWSTDERDAMIRLTAATDGTGVRIRGPQDPGAAGVDAAQAFTRMLSGYGVATERVSGAKETRADPFSSQVNAGNVSLVAAPWNKPFIEELRGFPMGTHDDQVDAGSDAFNDLAPRREADIF